MTLAICPQCGNKKVGAFTVCSGCSFSPATPEAQAQCLLLTDHYLSPDVLHAIASDIKAGTPHHFDEELVREIAESISQNPDALKMPLGCVIAMWAPFVILGCLIATIVGLMIFLSASR